MIMDFDFKLATPLLEFIEKYKDKLIGQTVTSYYRDIYTGASEQPAVFVLNDYALVIHYFWLSWMEVNVVDKDSFFADTTLNFLYRHTPGSRKLWFDILPLNDADFVGEKITDITVNRFSFEHETHPALGGIRKQGGDYFGEITVHLTNEKSFSFCGEDAIFDGYMDVRY